MKRMMMLTTTAYMSERFNRNNILILEELGYEVHVVANFDVGNPTTQEVLDEFKEWVDIHHGKCISIPVTKHPIDIENYVAYKKLLTLIEANHYEFIHCHTPVAGALGRLVAHKTKTKVIYTAHGFHFYKGAPIINWLVYYPIEWFLSRWTDLVITINQEDYKRTKHWIHAGRVDYVPGIGIDVSYYQKLDVDIEKKRREIGASKEDVMLLSVGELSKRKNHKIVLEAICNLNSSKIKYYIVGQGGLDKKYQKLILDKNLQNQVFLLGYRTDIGELCKAADLFVFPSVQEGLPVALMEAIACNTLCIASRIRGNVDLITDEKLLFQPKSVKDLEKTLSDALCYNKVLPASVSANLPKYSIDCVNNEMKKKYKYIIGLED